MKGKFQMSKNGPYADLDRRQAIAKGLETARKLKIEHDIYTAVFVTRALWEDGWQIVRRPRRDGYVVKG